MNLENIIYHIVEYYSAIKGIAYIGDYTLVNYNIEELKKIMFSEEVSHKRAHIV